MRDARIAELRRAETAAERMGTALQGISRAHRGYLLTGRAEFLAEGERERVQFEAAAARLADARERPWLARETSELRSTFRIWRDSAHSPTVAARARGGLRALAEGTPEAARIVRGTALMARMLEIQVREVREMNREIESALLDVERAEAAEAWESLLIRIGALAIFVLLLALILSLVGRALRQVVTAVEALEAGRYREARFPDAARAPNRETAQLAERFEQLAASIEERERQLQDDIEKLTELERLKRDFVSTVSHELRTPLTSLRGALGLMLGGKVGEIPAKGHELLRIATLNTDRLIRLINDILDVEKIDAGQIDVRRDRLHVRPLVQTTIASLEGFARSHQVELTLDTPKEADAEIIGDADRMVQVFTNLVSNAVKYSPAGASVEITITLSASQVKVRVRDHGPGISGEFATRIFGRFQQSADPALHRSGGTGLGLSIAKAIVGMHQGEIGFEPADGGGTIFWVNLPVVAPLARVEDPRRAILIIEDDPSMRDVLVAQFDAIARPIPVQSAEAALERLERDEIAAIVLDPGLPGMDGLAFARQIRQSERFRRMPMFLYSARAYTPEELRTAGIRATDAFVKSRDPESVLFDRIRRELQKAPTPIATGDSEATRS